jgi:hypothetical protein
MEKSHEHSDNAPDDIRRRLRSELIEELPDSPPSPSHIATQLRTAIQTAVLQAHLGGRPLEQDDAHIIAEFMSFAVDRPASHLAAFGHRNGLDYDGTREELLELAARPTLRLEMREVINWLSSYLLYQQAPELEPPGNPPGAWRHEIAYKEELGLTAALHIRGNPTRAEASDVFETATRFVLEHGVPALAFLRLPGSDAAAPDLDEDFRARYIGSFPTLRSAFAALVREGFGAVCAADVGGEVHLFRRYP